MIEVHQSGNILGSNRLKSSLLLLLLLFIIIKPTYAQLDSASIITEDVLDNLLIEPDIETNSEELVEIFEDLIRNPIDINSADAFELLKLPNMDSQSAQK